jgi:hypothetical protein
MPLPNVTYCLLCEGVRVEQGGKATVLGFLGVLPHVEMFVAADENLPETGTALTFLVATEGGDGAIKMFPRLLNPDGSTLKEMPEKVVKFIAGRKHNMGITVAPIVFQNIGVHTFQLLMDGEEHYRTSFVITGIDESLLPGRQMA